VHLELGEVCFKTRRWEEAISAFEQALDIAEEPATRAEITEWLGDVYAAYEPSTRHRLDMETFMQEKSQDRCEQYYEEAVKLWVRMGNIRHAHVTYEKLINRIITDESGLLQLPFTFLRILEELPLNGRDYDPFVNKAVEVLTRNEKIAEAGDIIVYTVRKLAKEDNSVVPLKEKLDYIKQAETLYRKGKTEDIIWGLNMLIFTFYRFSLWEEVTRCFEELFELSIQVEDADEFIETYGAINTLSDKIAAKSLIHFTKLALSAEDLLHLSIEKRMRLSLRIAKQYSSISEKFKDVKQKMKYEDLALVQYGKIIQTTGVETGFVSVALNDSALIHFKRQDYETALKKFGQSVQIDKKLNNIVGTSRSRINRARLYLEINEPDKAFSEFEDAIGPLQNECKYWDKRLETQDEQPLSPQEIIAMRYDREWLASASFDFAHLLISSGDFSQRVKELIKQAIRLFQAVGMEENARMAMAFVTLIENMRNMDEDEGFTCPSCGKSIEKGESDCPSCGQALCPECGSSIGDDDLECPHCGETLTFCCSNCGKEISSDDEVCPHCGESLEE
jgi:tetratricopeptide (TPR) repeat protein/RNA polymerase subunit RPABC4/transcription elongation factor Spt4